MCLKQPFFTLAYIVDEQIPQFQIIHSSFGENIQTAMLKEFVP